MRRRVRQNALEAVLRVASTPRSYERAYQRTKVRDSICEFAWLQSSRAIRISPRADATRSFARRLRSRMPRDQCAGAAGEMKMKEWMACSGHWIEVRNKEARMWVEDTLRKLQIGWCLHVGIEILGFNNGRVVGCDSRGELILPLTARDAVDVMMEQAEA